jgi:DNA-binding MarR family transcriptional regulator
VTIPSHGERLSALGGLTPLEGRAWSGLLRTHTRLVRVLTAELESAADVGLSGYDVLRTLALARDGQLRLSELADAVMLGRAGLSGLVTRLESNGLVQRVTAAEDRRGAYARLTGQGWRRLEAAHPVHVASIRKHFTSRLTPEQLWQLDACWRTLGLRGDE